MEKEQKQELGWRVSVLPIPAWSVYISAISDPMFRQLDIKQLRSENPNVPNRFIEIWYFESKIQISKSLMICFLDPNLEKKVFRSKLPIIAKMLKFSDFGSFAVSLLFFRKQGASTNCQNAKFGPFANKTDAIGSRKSSRLCSTRIQPKSELLADWWDRIRYGVGYRVGARPACRMWACTLEIEDGVNYEHSSHDSCLL